MPAQPPPTMPGPPNTPDSIANYLNRLSLWIYQELQQSVRKDEATAHLLLYAEGGKGGTSNVYSLDVDASGHISATQVPYGTGKP